jgi:hypothetical protein
MAPEHHLTPAEDWAIHLAAVAYQNWLAEMTRAAYPDDLREDPGYQAIARVVPADYKTGGTI